MVATDALLWFTCVMMLCWPCRCCERACFALVPGLCRNQSFIGFARINRQLLLYLEGIWCGLPLVQPILCLQSLGKLRLCGIYVLISHLPAAQKLVLLYL